MAGEENLSVMEGFLCPICKADLHSEGRLVAHFNDVHSEDQDLLKSLKDLLGKAKKKILNQEFGAETTSNSHSSVAVQNSFQWGEQETGATVSHTEFFRFARSARVEMYTVNKNRLLIRLDKLVENIPTDPVKKKAHEQRMVPWLDGKAVKRCPDCTVSFHAAPKFTRQHHCRLCGSVMCNDCSNFLPMTTARKILGKPETGSNLSGQNLRICVHCLKVLEMRERLQDVSGSKPLVCQLYDRLMDSRTHAEENAVQYRKMVTSLCCGETKYNLSDVQAIRMNILKQAESIDSISQKIAALGLNEVGVQLPIVVLRLHKSIRSASTIYLRSQLLSLPALPSENELKHAQFKRRQEMAAKIQGDKAQDSSKVKSPVSKPESLIYAPQQKTTAEPQEITVGQGWVPEKKQFFEVDDPLILQMKIIKNYIQEAKSAHKYDEVASLESNLQELNEEYWRQQQELEKIGEEELTNSTDSTQDSAEKGSSHSNDTQSEQLLASISSS